MPASHRDLLARSPPDLQLLEPIETLDALVVDKLPGLPQLRVAHPRAIAPVTLRQSHDALPQGAVAILARSISQRFTRHLVLEHRLRQQLLHLNTLICFPEEPDDLLLAEPLLYVQPAAP